MKAVWLLFLLSIPCACLYAQDDAVSVRSCLLSLHPENHRGIARYFDWKLDPHGDAVFTPGLAVAYDKGAAGMPFSHIRFAASVFVDCVQYPAGFAGAGAVFPLLRETDYSVYGCIGAGVYARKDWRSISPALDAKTMIRIGGVQWAVLPFPEIELRLHPWSSPCSMVFSIYSIIYVSMFSAGVQMTL
ncbi:MAG: hypothetical protein ACRCUT_10760 [Spirochaetota bacterium]